MVLHQMERPLINIVLDKTRGNQVRAAEVLGINLIPAQENPDPGDQCPARLTGSPLPAANSDDPAGWPGSSLLG